MRLDTKSRSPWTGWSSASWGSTRYSQSTKAWRASANWPENSRASSSLCCLDGEKKMTAITQQILFFTVMQTCSVKPSTPVSVFIFSLPLHALAADGVPFVTNFSQKVIQFLRVCRQLSFVPHGLPRPHRGVVDGLFWSQCFLKLLERRKNDGREKTVAGNGAVKKTEYLMMHFSSCTLCFVSCTLILSGSLEISSSESSLFSASSNQSVSFLQASWN